MAKKYCENCGKAQMIRSIQKTEDYAFLHDIVESETELVVCAQCGHIISKKVPGEEKLLNAYRKKHHILFPREIRAIREKYRLSVNAFSILMHWSDKTIKNYEKGVLPSPAHNSMLLMLRNPENMKMYLENNDNKLPSKRIRKLMKRLDELSIPMTSHGPFFRRYFSDIPDCENGYKGFDYHTACAMVLYFSAHEKNIMKMKLMSLLYYADMLYYSKYGMSMSGIRYVRLPYGAIAENMDILFGIMEEDDLICIDVRYTRKNEHHIVTDLCDLPDEILTVTQLDVLQTVCERFKDMDAKQVLKCIRRERNYQKAQDRNYICYDASLKMQWELCGE